MNDEILIELGYTQFCPSPYESENVITCFQKRFQDSKGTKYFITINKWKGWHHPHTGEIICAGYESNIQFYKKDSHKALDLTFHIDWDIDEVESYAEKLFDTGLFDYYENFVND